MCNNNHQRPCVCCVLCALCHHSTHPQCPPPSTLLSTANNNKNKGQPMCHRSTHHQPRLLSLVLWMLTQPHLHAPLPPCLSHTRSLCRSLCVKSSPPHNTRCLCSHPSPLVPCVRPTHSTISTPPHTPLPLSNQPVCCHIAPPPCHTQPNTPCAAFHCP